MMPENSPHTYQSGETVPHTATYEVVGVDASQPMYSKNHERAVQLLYEGDTFPNHEGRQVQWVIRQLTAPDQTSTNRDKEAPAGR
jgi:hypothetical protein